MLWQLTRPGNRAVGQFCQLDHPGACLPVSPSLPQLERARRLAAQYTAAALQSRPRLKLHMVLDAPKVAVPAADARGRVTLALDFGRFIIESGGLACLRDLLGGSKGVRPLTRD